MSVSRAAQLVGVSTSTIYRWIEQGYLAAAKRGRRWYITGTIGRPKEKHQNPKGEDAADNPHHGTQTGSRSHSQAAPVGNRRDSRRDGSGAGPARDGPAPRPTQGGQKSGAAA